MNFLREVIRQLKVESVFFSVEIISGKITCLLVASSLYKLAKLFVFLDRRKCNE